MLKYGEHYFNDYEELFLDFKAAFQNNCGSSCQPEAAMYDGRTEKSWTGQNGWSRTHAIHSNGRITDTYEVRVFPHTSIKVERFCVPSVFSSKPDCSDVRFYLIEYGVEKMIFASTDSFRRYCSSYGGEIDLCTGVRNKDAANTFMLGLQKVLPEVLTDIYVCDDGEDSGDCIKL